MDFLIQKEVSGDMFELVIDTKIFSKNIVLKTAYNFLDLWYFIFAMVGKNIKVQCKKKAECHIDSEEIILKFCDELLNVYLRSELEKDNKVIREEIITAALSWSIDMNNYVEIDIKKENSTLENEIENILKELENDPELKIDEDDIKKLLGEIEWKKTTESILNVNNLNDVKKKFQNR